MARFEFRSTALAGVMAAQRRAVADSRGFFSRFYCRDEFQEAGLDKAISQINHTFTRAQGALRGMHFQHPPHAEVKAVSVLKGRIFDVAVDLRKNSPTFLQWHAEELSAENMTSLIIPEGCAHGFQTLEPDCELIYLHTAPYVAGSEGAVNAREPRLDIAWPIAITEMSDRDRGHPFLPGNYEGLIL